MPAADSVASADDGAGFDVHAGLGLAGERAAGDGTRRGSRRPARATGRGASGRPPGGGARRARLRVCRAAGRRRRAPLLDTMRARSGGRLPATGAIAAALEELGDHEAAVALLDEAIARHDVWLVQFPRSPRTTSCGGTRECRHAPYSARPGDDMKPRERRVVVIVGGTGMVGGYALRYALVHPSVGAVTVIGRRKLGISHPRLNEVLHRDFGDCSALAEALSITTRLSFASGRIPARSVRGPPHDNRGLCDRVRASSPREQPRRGFFIPERERRGSDGTAGSPSPATRARQKGRCWR